MRSRFGSHSILTDCNVRFVRPWQRLQCCRQFALARACRPYLNSVGRRYIFTQQRPSVTRKPAEMFTLKLVKSILVTSLLGWLTLVQALSSTLQQVTENFGSNPNNVGMYIYKPTALATPTPLIIAMHYCTGTAQAYFQGTSLAQLADAHGFIVVYPNAPRSGGCWDVATTATLTHNSGGDSLGIASLVRYAISNWGVDSKRVFATGTSSGAMMTNVLLGAYPDLFAAGSLYSGVPYACFAGSSAWNSQCAQGQLIKTGQQWVSSFDS